MRSRTAAIGLLAIVGCSMRGPYSRADAGLGTAWGESRRSPLREVPFERASQRPFLLASILYDDRAGIEALAAQAEPVDPPRDAGLELAVIDDEGAPFETLRAAGRTCVVGVLGERYRLRVRNRTSRTVEVVASVDGLDVMDGRRASLQKRGYLVEPDSTLVIDGFRRSVSEVAAFRFGAKRRPPQGCAMTRAAGARARTQSSDRRSVIGSRAAKLSSRRTISAPCSSARAM
jgi:hypothetical protein